MDTIDTETGEVILCLGMPPQIAAAIIAVKKNVKQLGSDERNAHGGYSYVSVDKFYERIGKLMADAGLALLIDETESEVKEGKSGNPWLFVQFSLSFMHETGIMSRPVRRSCALPISGPQAFGAAQSYIEKQFLRQVFKVPTGDRDADDTAPQENSAPGRAQSAPGGRTAAPASRQQQQPPPAAAPAQPPPQQAAEPSGEDRHRALALWKALRDDIDASQSAEELHALLRGSKFLDCHAAVAKAEKPEVAESSMQKLVDRAAARKEMLDTESIPENLR